MSNPRHRILSALVLIVGIGLVYLGLSGTRRKVQPDPVAELDRRALSEEQRTNLDLKILKSPQSTAEQVYGALVRLSVLGERDAFEIAQQRRGDENPLVRAGAAKALGHCPEDACFEALTPLLRDPDTRVREHAIAALAMSPNPRKGEVLARLASDKSLAPSDELALLEAQLKAPGLSEKDAARIVDRIESLATKGPEPIRQKAVLTLIQTQPQNPDVLAFLNERVEAGKDLQVASVAVRHLASVRDERYVRSIDKLVNGPPPVAVAALQTLHLSCPEDPWLVLNSVLKQAKNPEIRLAAIRASVQLGGTQAVSFLESLGLIEQLPTAEKAVAADLLETARKQPPEMEACQKK